ncbi:MAG TPA: CBS domain-containing protein [Terriglobales bacterium]|jgi:CBS domain-containing protein|nr:CBS domain-containing protein [Terriglobales bacterium]
MCSIYDLVKEQEMCLADVNDSVMQVARAMVERNIGAVPVLREGKLAGVFSERDLMRRIVVEGRNPQTTKVGDVMTPQPLSVSRNDDLEHCLRLMREHGFRHLPVCEGGQLLGFVSLRDMLLRDLSEKDDEVRLMRAYIHSAPEI